MDLLHTWPLADWLRFSLALIFFTGPGYALATFVRRSAGFDRTGTAGLALAVAVSFWPLLLAWLHLFGIVLTPLRAGAIIGLGWLGALGMARLAPALPSHAVTVALPRATWLVQLLLWLVLLLSAAVQVSALHSVVVTPGSDGYHHTLFAQEIMARGGLPTDLLPLTPLMSFTYHPGFHSLVAGVGWLTDLSAVTLTPLIGQVLKAGAALAAVFFVLTVLRNYVAAVVCALVIGLIAVFPAFFVNWGRTTQLLGFVVLPVLLALIWQWSADLPRAWWPLPVVAVLAAGLVLIHYRVTVMAAIGAVVILAANGLAGRWKGSDWGAHLLRLTTAGLLAGLLVLPWGWQVYSARLVGYPAEIGAQEPGVFNLARLGYGVLNYPTNWPLVALFGLALLWAIWQRSRVILVLSLWSGLLFWLSGPRYLNIYMDTVTVFTSFYFMFGVIVGWLGAELWVRFTQRLSLLRWVLALGLAALTLVGARAVNTIVQPGATFVGPDDLPAMRWIAANTPAAAYFMVNTFHFDFAPNYIIGSDAGFWLPALAQRRTVTAPMSYPIERNLRPDYTERIVALHQLGGDLTTPQAIRLLAAEGVNYVYVGQRGGLIDVAALLASPAYRLEYQNGAAYVFRLVGGAE